MQRPGTFVVSSVSCFVSSDLNALLLVDCFKQVSDQLANLIVAVGLDDDAATILLVVVFPAADCPRTLESKIVQGCCPV